MDESATLSSRRLLPDCTVVELLAIKFVGVMEEFGRDLVLAKRGPSDSIESDTSLTPVLNTSWSTGCCQCKWLDYLEYWMKLNATVHTILSLILLGLSGYYSYLWTILTEEDTLYMAFTIAAPTTVLLLVWTVAYWAKKTSYYRAVEGSEEVDWETTTASSKSYPADLPTSEYQRYDFLSMSYRRRWGDVTHSQTFAVLASLCLTTGCCLTGWGGDILLESNVRPSQVTDAMIEYVGVASLVCEGILAPLTTFIALTWTTLSRLDATMEVNPIIQFLRCTFMSLPWRRFVCGVCPAVCMVSLILSTALYARSCECESFIQYYLFGASIVFALWAMVYAVVYTHRGKRRNALSLFGFLACSIVAIGYGVVGFVWLAAKIHRSSVTLECAHDAPHLLFLVVCVKTACILVGSFSLCCQVCCRVERYFDEHVGVEEEEGAVATV